MLGQLLRAWQPRGRQPLPLEFRLQSPLQVVAAARSAQGQQAQARAQLLQARPVVLTVVDLQDAALQSESPQPGLQQSGLQQSELQRLLAQQLQSQSQSLTFRQSLLASELANSAYSASRSVQAPRMHCARRVLAMSMALQEQPPQAQLFQRQQTRSVLVGRMPTRLGRAVRTQAQLAALH